MMRFMLPEERLGPLTSSHLVRWCAAQLNWDKIHYDYIYATEVAGLKERVINGSLKQHLLVRYLENSHNGKIRLIKGKVRFAGPDFVNESLVIGGVVKSDRQVGGRKLVEIDVEIRNEDQDRVTTNAKFFGFLDVPPYANITWGDEFNDLLIDKSDVVSVLDNSSVPESLLKFIGKELRNTVSYGAFDLSRARLFADAIGDVAGYYYSIEEARKVGLNAVHGMALYPIHCLEGQPGTKQLSTDSRATGREGVEEFGGNVAELGGFSGEKLVNGGNEIEIHSLIRVGEIVRVTSKLHKLDIKVNRIGGEMLVVDVLNSFWATANRLLLRGKQTTIYRDWKYSIS